MLDLFFLRAWHVKKELRALFRQFDRNKTVRVLDAGTGFGQYAYYICRTFPNAQVLAVDVKSDYLDTARTFFARTGLEGCATFAYEDLTELKTAGPFDLILSVDVMEHIEEDRKVFDNFFEVLHEGGYVLINTPSDLGGSDVHDASEEGFIGEHVRDGYNMEELKGKLAASGLSTVQARYTYGKYGSLAWRFLIKYPISLLSFNKIFVILLPLYYIPVVPIGMLLNALDVRSRNARGTGLIVVASKDRA